MRNSNTGIAKQFSDDRSIVFDVGCHLGEDTQYYLSRGFRVVGFECLPDNVNWLLKRFSHEISNGLFILESRALVHPQYNLDWVTFYKDDLSVWGTIHKDWKERNSKLGSKQVQVKVPTFKSDLIFKTYGVPYYMKIDVEGQDVEVLKSLKALDFNCRPKYVSIESTKTCWNDLLEEFNLLLNLGYTAFQVVGQSRNSLKITKWKDIEGKEIVFHHLLHSSGPFGLDLDDGSWLPANKAIRKYKLIFVKYRLFGDHGLLTGEKIRHRHIRVVYQKILRRLRLNSDWYDTHARR